MRFVIIVLVVCAFIVSCSDNIKNNIIETESNTTDSNNVVVSDIHFYIDSTTEFVWKKEMFREKKLLEITDYYKNTDSLVSHILYVDSIQHINQSYYYHNGIIDTNKSVFISLYPKKDTIIMGDEYELTVKLEASKYNQNFSLVIGKLNNQYKIINPDSAILTSNKDKNLYYKYPIEYKTLNYKLGNNIIEGFAYDWSLLVSDSLLNIGDTANAYLEKHHRIYFKKSFYVKEE